MKAINVVKLDNNYDLKIIHCPIPIISENEVLIKTSAFGINRADLMQAQGRYNPPKDASPILGLEVSGIIAEIGSNVCAYKIGDKVCALVNGGAYAEYINVHQNILLKVPSNLDMLQAASIPEALYTSYFNLVMKAKLEKGENLLLHGAASGVSTYAIQLAKSLKANVIATVSTDEKCEYCKSLGADIVINYNKHDILEIIEPNINVILDSFAGNFMHKNIELLAYGGRLLLIALAKGSISEINYAPILLKNLTIMGTTLRSQSTETKINITNKITEEIWPKIEIGEIKPVIDRIFAFDDIMKAHDYMKSNTHMGKIVISI